MSEESGKSADYRKRKNSLNESVRSYTTKYILPSALPRTKSKLIPDHQLEPKGRILKSVDAIRIFSAYSEAIKRAEIATALPFIIENISILRFSFGADLIEVIERHCRIQSAYQDSRNRLEFLIKSKTKVLERINALKASSGDEATKRSHRQHAKPSLFDFFERTEVGEEGGGEEEYEDDNEVDEFDVQESEVPSSEQKSTLQVVVQVFPSIDEKPSFDAPNSDSDSHDKTSNQDEIDIALSELSDVTDLNSVSHQSSKKDEGRRHTKLSFHSVDTFTKTSMLDLEITLSIYEPQIEDTVKQLAQISRKVVHSLKNVLRLFTINPMALKTLSKHTIIRNPRSAELLELMRELGGILKSRLLVTPEEERFNLEYLESILRREERTKEYIAKLENDLKSAKGEMDEEFQTKLEVIENLKSDIKQIEAFSNENIRRTLGNAEKIEFNCNKNSEQRTKLVRDDVAVLEAKLEDASKANREAEANLRTEKYKVETELETLIKRYDADMGNKMDEYERLEIIYENERKILAEMEDKFADLETEYMNLMDERLQARRRDEWIAREEKRFLTQIITIQSYWRSYIARKAIQKEVKRLAKEAKRQEMLQKALEKKKLALKTTTD